MKSRHPRYLWKHYFINIMMFCRWFIDHGGQKSNGKAHMVKSLANVLSNRFVQDALALVSINTKIWWICISNEFQMYIIYSSKNSNVFNLDDCTTNENCECRQLTVEAHNRLMKSLQLPKSKHSVIGYYYRQLKDKLINGVYECNSQCKCSKRTCFNRVVQQDLKIPMQVNNLH
jgi:hypothetical protein